MQFKSSYLKFLLNSSCPGLPLAKYRTLMAAVDSPIGSPIQPVVTDLRDGFRDPTRFRYSAIERPDIQPATSINLLRGQITHKLNQFISLFQEI